MVTLPRLVVAAPASGQGKTTVAVGLMAALVERGLAVAPAKVGPDYIDPGYHALATGRPGRNLDPWLTSPDLVAPLLVHGARTPAAADVAVIEGVMGLFDGRIGADGFASTAHVARLTASPVLVVVDISSASRTVAALVEGLRAFDPDVQVAGIVLNKAGSARHADEVRGALEARGLPVLGVLPRDAGVSAPSRHLGLVPAAERPEAAATLARLAEQTARHVDVDAVLELARSAPDLDVEPWSPDVVRAGTTTGSANAWPAPVVAVAGGRAFTFRYAETEELLRAAGCKPVVFDPAHDTELPAGTSGIYLGGGFPEAHAAALSTNQRLLHAVGEAVRAGTPTVAECAGLLYLARSLDEHAMVGAVPATAAMHPRLTLRYAVATLPTDSVLGPAGTTVHAHEFHRTRTDPTGLGAGAWSVEGAPDGFALDPAGTGRPTLHASYLHTHWAGNPSLATHFAQAVHSHADSAGRTDRGLGAHGGPLTEVAGGTAGQVRTPSRVTELAEAPRPDPLLHHGDAEVRDDGADLVDLAVNVRLPRPPGWLLDRIREASTRLAAYPDTRAARAALAEHHGVGPECVLPTNGAAEAFTLVATALQGRHPLVVHPQFTEPEAALRRAGRVPDRHVLRADTGFVLDPGTVDPRADLVLVGNPCNPTGVLTPGAVLRELHRPGRTLVVDEAFLDAVPGQPGSLVGPELADTLVVRSLTKTWGLAGLRAGYVVGDPRLVAALERRQTAWSVSSLAAEVMVATASSGARDEAADLARVAAADRAHLVRGLEGLGLRPVRGVAPFVLVETGVGVREALRDKGFAVRRGDTFPGLSAAWVRIAVRERGVTETFLQALAGVLRTVRRSTTTTPEGLSA
ncbi:cobyrinate a,c-diamide synthase [Pedococcus sp. NPDC057267]|uniref:cobyrinate a,c-diamide synthase n=1 Tax=Pedococcus sp. NPDC057267 TaxID=3346077 RepID=UPI00362619F8